MCSSRYTSANLCMFSLSSERHAFLSTAFCNNVFGLRFHHKTILNVKLKKN